MGGVCNLNNKYTDSSNLTLLTDSNAINNFQIQKTNDSSCFKLLMLTQKKLFLEDPIEQNTTKLDQKKPRNLKIECEISYTDINLTPKGILKSPKSKSPEFNKRNTSKSNNTQNKGEKWFTSQKKRKPKVTFEILDNLF